MNSPLSLDDRHRAGTLAPAVVGWCRIYAGFMTALFAFSSVVTTVMMAFPPEEVQRGEMPLYAWHLYAGFFSCGGFLLLALHVALFFVPRRPWAWGYHLIVIGLGLPSPCT